MLSIITQYLQVVLLLFSINFPIFQYFACFTSIFQYFTISSIYTIHIKSSNVSVFSEFCQYLCSGFSKNTGKSVYFKAMITVRSVNKPGGCRKWATAALFQCILLFGLDHHWSSLSAAELLWLKDLQSDNDRYFHDFDELQLYWLDTARLRR